jgi:hypothetical protein
VQRGDDWVNTKRFTNSAGNTTRVTRGDQGGIISRRGPDGSGFVGKNGENVYAGRDGNVYRRDQNGNWQKWENGNWNSPARPEQRNSVRDSMMNDRARTDTRPSGDRIGNSSSSRPTQMDRNTVNSLERDRAARSAGSQRSRDYGNYSRSPSSNRSVGGYRGGGGSRGGGGGFRGGGRRR